MKNKFLLGAVAGMSSIALAVPVIAQISSAATSDTGSSTSAVAGMRMFGRPVPTQEQIQEMITRETAFLQNIDAFVAIQKKAKQDHLTAITAAAAITDDTQRAAALKKAHQDERAAIEAAIAANPALQTMKPMGGHGMGGMGMKRGHGPKGGFMRGPMGTAPAATTSSTSSAQ